MLDSIIKFSIKNKLVIGVMTLLLIIWGSWSVTRLPIDAVPDITNNQVQIITLCPTLAGQEVEQLVTFPIEQSIANLPDLEETRSISRFGLSVITVVFDDDVDIYFARQLVNLSKNDLQIKKLITGNTAIVRDFLDVRDVVRAYDILVKNGRKGEVYNICSGNGIMLKDIIHKMSDLLNIQIELEVNPDLIRPNENKKIIGSYRKINEDLGWQPVIPIEKSLKYIIEYWQMK